MRGSRLFAGSLALLAAFALGDGIAFARGTNGSHSSSTTTKGTTKKKVKKSKRPQKHRSTWSKFAKRAKNGRIARSSSARSDFLKSIGIADGHTPKGYIVDHIVPLAAGGPDTPSNMRLITKAQENAQHSAEVKSGQQGASSYDPYKYSGKNGALGGSGTASGASAPATTKHHHHRTNG